MAILYHSSSASDDRVYIEESCSPLTSPKRSRFSLEGSSATNTKKRHFRSARKLERPSTPSMPPVGPPNPHVHTPISISSENDEIVPGPYRRPRSSSLPIEFRPARHHTSFLSDIGNTVEYPPAIRSTNRELPTPIGFERNQKFYSPALNLASSTGNHRGRSVSPHMHEPEFFVQPQSSLIQIVLEPFDASSLEAKSIRLHSQLNKHSARIPSLLNPLRSHFASEDLYLPPHPNSNLKWNYHSACHDISSRSECRSSRPSISDAVRPHCAKCLRDSMIKKVLVHRMGNWVMDDQQGFSV